MDDKGHGQQTFSTERLPDRRFLQCFDAIMLVIGIFKSAVSPC